MRMNILQLRAFIRESIEQGEFTWKIAKAAKAGKKSVKVGDEEFPVKMSKKKADDIIDEEELDEV